jgi:hypothetical protein
VSSRGQQFAAAMKRRYTGLDKALVWQVLGFLAFALFTLWAERSDLFVF